MKRFLPLLALVVAPHFALAQPRPRPAAPPSCKPKLPNAQELFDHLYAPYEAAKTFRGTFDIKIQGNVPKTTISEIHLKTLFRFDVKGDFSGENTSVENISRPNLNQRQTIQTVVDGRAGKMIFVDQKVWWLADQINDAGPPTLATSLKPLLQGVVDALNKMPDFEPVIKRSMEAGRPIFVLTAKHTNVLRVVVDAQTRALRSFELANSLSIRGSNQVFNEPIGDEELKWTPPADYKQVAQGEVTLPAFLGATIQNGPIKTAPTAP